MKGLALRVDDLTRSLGSFDHRGRWFGIGRSLIALSTLSTLVFTPMRALVVPVGGLSGPNCTSIRRVSLLCVGDPASGLEVRRYVMIVVLLLVVIGLFPRWTAIPHAYVAFTMSASTSLPDGGDAIAATLTMLIIPLCLADSRRWQWQGATSPLPITWAAIALPALIAVRLQLAFVYLDSAISKFGVDDWSNGTAEYYILRDPGFGDAGLFHRVWLALSSHPWGAIGLTWGAIVVEIAIGLTLLFSWRWRVVALGLDVALHSVIIMTMGLFSFATVMIGGAVVASVRTVHGHGDRWAECGPRPVSEGPSHHTTAKLQGAVPRRPK